jgi:hypothetical protein
MSRLIQQHPHLGKGRGHDDAERSECDETHPASGRFKATVRSHPQSVVL